MRITKRWSAFFAAAVITICLAGWQEEGKSETTAEKFDRVQQLMSEEQYAEAAELIAELKYLVEAERFMMAEDYESATEMYTKLIDQSKGSEYLPDRAYCYTNLGRMAEAEEDRNRYAAAGGTGLGNADVMLGIGWMRAKEYDKANDCFIRAIDEGFADPGSLYSYVVLCSYMTGNYQRVCDYGDQLIALVQNGGKTATAEIGVEKMTGRLNISLVKMDLAALYQMNGASHLATGNYETAESRLTACLAEKPDDAYASYLRGVSRLALGRFSEAAADFDTSVAADVETERSRYSRAICRMQTGDTEGAADDLDWVLLHGTDKELFETASALQTQLIAGDSPVINE